MATRIEIGNVRGDEGPQGPRGNYWYRSSYEATANQSGLYWSDLTPARSPSDPPQKGDMAVMPSGNIMSIIGVSPNSDGTSGSNGGGTYQVGAVLGNIVPAQSVDELAVFKASHPVGSLFPTTVSTNPGSIYTGTEWVSRDCLDGYLWQRTK